MKTYCYHLPSNRVPVGLALASALACGLWRFSPCRDFIIRSAMKAILRVFLLIVAATSTSLLLVSTFQGRGIVVNAVMPEQEVKVSPGVIEDDEFASVGADAQRKPHVPNLSKFHRVDVKFCTS